ncbi:DUF6146 family protein [Gillisia sp. Hel_I_29]|uniref:DUF6146 family protein n=1 Tax=Gillisia sp. Hel_I_29 TaxID=1249975 RepID=UPI0005537CA8|nr:DUF6146 family protein [Gillisia sp. Hel_I_29]
MKNLFYIFLLALIIYSCGTGNRNFKGTDANAAVNDTVRIANDSLEYEVIVIEPGFNLFLNSIARPRAYYSQTYLENKNQFLVRDYNARVMQPQRFNSNLYIQEINYDPNIDYGYEVNYLIYNYFVFISREYNQKFSVPTRI